MGGPELSAGWYEIWFRSVQAGDRTEPSEVVFLEPHSLAAALAHGHDQSVESAEMKQRYQDLLKTVLAVQGRCLLLVPVQGADPEHWTSLTLIRESGADKPFVVQYEDSLDKEHTDCRLQAERIYGFLRHLGAKLPDLRLPETKHSVSQKGVTCGWHVLNRFEEQLRELRGEGSKRVYNPPDQRRQSINRLCQHLKEHFHPIVPSQPAQSVAATMPPPPPPLKLPAPQPAPKQKFGCPKCRHSERGCAKCSPEQAVRYVQREQRKVKREHSQQ